MLGIPRPTALAVIWSSINLAKYSESLTENTERDICLLEYGERLTNGVCVTWSKYLGGYQVHDCYRGSMFESFCSPCLKFAQVNSQKAACLYNIPGMHANNGKLYLPLEVQRISGQGPRHCRLVSGVTCNISGSSVEGRSFRILHWTNLTGSFFPCRLLSFSRPIHTQISFWLDVHQQSSTLA